MFLKLQLNWGEELDNMLVKGLMMFRLGDEVGWVGISLYLFLRMCEVLINTIGGVLVRWFMLVSIV
ncbi:hypothetical protein, partial [Staphylococcus pettenkoferi]|uniref:hypothetical protein n=1 Tax=Staphylococcus pettenkoferi TaxID=170573 RepID=UPI001C92BF8C